MELRFPGREISRLRISRISLRQFLETEKCSNEYEVQIKVKLFVVLDRQTQPVAGSPRRRAGQQEAEESAAQAAHPVPVCRRQHPEPAGHLPGRLRVRSGEFVFAV